MYQSDWMLRQIEMMGIAFRRLLEALREHRPADALDVSREAVGELLETDPFVIDMLSGEALVMLLSPGDVLDTFRAHMLGELLAARSEALTELGRADEAAAERARARALLEAALPVSDGTDADRIAEVLGWLRAV